MARYEIDPDRSKVSIDARSSVHPIHSDTSGLEGFVDIEWSPDGTIDMDTTPTARISLPVSRLSSGNRLEDREMQRRVDSRRYPTIDGVLHQIGKSDGNGTYDVSGDVTFRGVTKRYEDHMVISAIDDSTVHLAGSSQFDIRDFGMEPPKVLMLRVHPEVEVGVDIVARKA